MGRFLQAPVLCCLFVAAAAGGARQRPQELWVHMFFSVATDQGRDQALELLDRAAAAGFTHALLADGALNELDRPDPQYVEHLEAVRDRAEEVGIQLVPGVMPIGYSGAIIARNRNLDEGMPVRDALFLVDGSEARLQPDPPLAVPDPGFERADGDVFSDWDWQDRPGETTFCDRQVFRSGSASLRMTDVGVADPENGNGRINARIAVSPFRQYHAAVWVKTQDFDTNCMVRLFIATPEVRPLSFEELDLEPTQDWTRYDMIFNSLESREILVYLGVWGGGTGSIWWDDLTIEEIGLVNFLHRDGTPLRVLGEGGEVYEPGVDYEMPADMNDGRARWYPWYESFPEAQPLRLTADSRIQDGQRLRVSFYHAAHVLGHQTMCCLSEPEVYEILEAQIRGVQEHLAPRTWFMNHDEIRVANWCEACQSRGLTPGGILADNVRRCQEIIQRVSPGSRIVVWSDMFDPNHNARGDYYAVNGSWAGSWEGLLPTTDVANWYHGGGLETMRWFSQRGHRQILCGYYDNPDFYTAEWLAEGEKAGVEGLIGAMYTTWVPDYGLLEEWAESLGGS